eukprot:4602844-Amphidinium_carterae.2
MSPSSVLIEGNTKQLHGLTTACSSRTVESSVEHRLGGGRERESIALKGLQLLKSPLLASPVSDSDQQRTEQGSAQQLFASALSGWKRIGLVPNVNGE